MLIYKMYANDRKKPFCEGILQGGPINKHNIATGILNNFDSLDTENLKRIRIDIVEKEE